MKHLKTIAAATAMAGSLGLAALGIGTGVANAAPAPLGPGTEFAQDPGWGHGWDGPGWRGDDWNRGPGWGPPPPPNYGYGGWGGGCVTGPLGVLQWCR